MSAYSATVAWERKEAVFTDNRYSRSHVWRFDGGAEVSASSSPQVVPPPYSDATCVDPEEAFVAALSSCHMLWFLSIAAKEGLVIERYQDRATGVMEKNSEGKLAMTRVTLRPKVIFSGPRLPTRQDIVDMHHVAHEQCYIANSVKTDVRCEPVSCSCVKPNGSENRWIATCGPF
jgi:organic hydroperoxide reductase OsmC/OhrA